MTAAPTRVLVADDHPAYRRGVVRALERAGLEVVAQAGDGAAALALARELAPDVALLDLRMPEATGSEIATALRNEGSPTRVVVLSAYIEPEVVSAALSAGVYGYLSKDASRAAIVWAVAAAADGEPVGGLPS
jgi:two-component system, NarL family, nitrate/nitrite response regulator NarL